VPSLEPPPGTAYSPIAALIAAAALAGFGAVAFGRGEGQAGAGGLGSRRPGEGVEPVAGEQHAEAGR